MRIICVLQIKYVFVENYFTFLKEPWNIKLIGIYMRRRTSSFILITNTSWPIIITENGLASEDDERRIEFIKRAVQHLVVIFTYWRPILCVFQRITYHVSLQTHHVSRINVFTYCVLTYQRIYVLRIDVSTYLRIEGTDSLSILAMLIGNSSS